MNISTDMVADFQKDGVLLLRGVFRDWVRACLPSRLESDSEL